MSLAFFSAVFGCDSLLPSPFAIFGLGASEEDGLADLQVQHSHRKTKIDFDVDMMGCIRGSTDFDIKHLNIDGHAERCGMHVTNGM